ncbi:MAG TPA: rod shape-determining protein MreD [Mycobacteriales bacterium]|nr:rod shape-determining protein MreD [Mycobacteriales bacterium]
MRRGLLVVAVAFTALLLQASLIARLPLPGGWPDLPLLCVLAFALCGGPLHGAIVGFGVGLAADVLPPADHTIGRLALAFAVAGYVAGLVEDAEERSVVTTMVLVAFGSAVAVLVFAGVGALVGDPRVTGTAVAHSLAATVLYDVVLAPFVVPLLAAAVRRAEPAA